MGDDDRREIFERLAALERMVRSRHDERASREHDRRGDRDRDRGDRDHGGRHDGGCDRGEDDFQEKRIIDTIVRLVSEQVERLVDGHQSQSRQQDEGGEKRIVDLIVRLVSEHVQEIVATELDRRFGSAAPAGEERRALPPSSKSSEPD